MPKLCLHRKHKIIPSLPYWVFVNKHPVGLMKGKDVVVEMPAGVYDIGVRIVFAIGKLNLSVGGSKRVVLLEQDTVKLNITDKERWWNILFDVDLLLWVAEFFLTLPKPWHTVYVVLSNGFFIVWLLRLWIIRNRYFVLEA